MKVIDNYIDEKHYIKVQTRSWLFKKQVKTYLKSNGFVFEFKKGIGVKFISKQKEKKVFKLFTEPKKTTENKKFYYALKSNN